MRVLFVGDIHGVDHWKKPVGEAIAVGAHVVFLGDYVDAFEIEPYQIFENLKDIIEIKKNHLGKVTLLLGNHDYAYMYNFSGISGFNFHMRETYRDLFKTNWDLFDAAWGFQGKKTYTLATHAGLTKTYYDMLEKIITTPDTTMNKVLVQGVEKNWKDLPLHELLNYFKDQANDLWVVGRERGGYYRTGGILWADKRELVNNVYPGIDQVVGHTPGKFVDIRNFGENKIYFIDNHYNETVFTVMMELD